MTTPVNKVTGVGPKTVEYLKKHRVTTAEALVKRGTSVLETAPGFSPGRAENVIHAANKLLHGEAVIEKTASKPEVDKPKKKKKDKKEKRKDKDKKLKDKKQKKNKKNKKDNKSKKKKGKKNKK